MPRIDDHLLAIMAYAAAPLKPDSVLCNVDDLDREDMTEELLIDELEYYATMCGSGLDSFVEAMKYLKDGGSDGMTLDSDDATNPSQIPSTSVSRIARLNLIVYLLFFFMGRLTKLGQAISHLADGCRQEYLDGDNSPEATEELRRLINMVNNNARPKNLRTQLDLAINIPWNMPDISSRQNANVQSANRSLRWNSLPQQQRQSSSLQSSTSAFGGRRRYRIPTGYCPIKLKDTDTPRSSSPSTFSQEEPKPLKRQHSSFDSQEAVEINDGVADPHWDEELRAIARERRVRKRIPTGHPSMMKSAMIARMSLESAEAEDDETMSNTERNRQHV